MSTRYRQPKRKPSKKGQILQQRAQEKRAVSALTWKQKLSLTFDVIGLSHLLILLVVILIWWGIDKPYELWAVVPLWILSNALIGFRTYQLVGGAK